MKAVYLMYETIPLPVISSGGIMLLEDTVKTATASMSREIFLGRGNTGLFNAFSCFAAPASARRIHPLPFGLPPSLRGHLLPIFSIVGVIHRNAGLWRRAAPKAQDGLMSLEMMTDRKSHIGEDSIPDVRDHPAPRHFERWYHAA